MTSNIPQPSLFSGLDDSPTSHARRTDPDTSHQAATAVKITKQAHAILESYKDGSELTDHEAYQRSGFSEVHHARQRCSDLRRAGLIARTGNKATSPSGRPAHVCAITERGRLYLG